MNISYIRVLERLKLRRFVFMVTHPVIGGYQLSVQSEKNLNCLHAVCITSVISDVNTDRKLPLYFKPQNKLKVSYVRMMNISYQEHSYL